MPRIEPHQPQRNAVALSGQRQSARGGEIERLGIARDFSDHRRHFTAVQALLKREQHVFRLFAGDMDQPVPKSRRQACAVRTPTQLERGAVLHPHQRAAIIGFGGGIGLGIAQRIGSERQCCSRAARLGCRSEYLAVVSRRQPRSPARGARGNLRQFGRGHEDAGLGHGSGTTHLFRLCSITNRFATPEPRVLPSVRISKGDPS